MDHRYKLLLASLLVLVVGSPHKSCGQDRRSDKREHDLVEFAGRGDVEQVKSLLSHGVSANAKNEYGQSALHRAAIFGKLEVVELLLDEGAEIHASTRDGESVLEIASVDPKMFRLLLNKRAKPTGKSLRKACWLGNDEAVNILLEAGVPPNEGLTGASQGGHSKIVRLLLSKGADVNHANDIGSTALHVGALQGGPDVVRLLLAAGADPNIRDQQGRTSLHRAVTGDGDPQVVQQLIDAGAKPNLADNEGVTPLREAGRRNGPVYEMLLKSNGGIETVVMPPNRDQPDKSNAELFAELSNREKREAAELALVARGPAIVPDLEAALDAEEDPGRLLSLIPKLGPNAKPLLPKLEKMLGDPRYVFGVSICIQQMHPRAFAGLSAEVRHEAADALYYAIVDPANAETAGFFVKMLPMYGEPATPYILKFLRSEKPGYRVAGAKCVSVMQFHSQELEEELVNCITSDKETVVRGWAALAARNPLFHSEECRRALTGLINEFSADNLYEAQQAVGRATASLATFGNSAIAELVPIVETRGDEGRIKAVQVWQSLPPEANDALADLLEHSHPNVVLAASVALSRRDPAAAIAVAKKLYSPNEAVRRKAADILLKIRGAKDAPVPRLIELAEDPAQGDLTRMTAARAALVLNRQVALKEDTIISLVPMLTTALSDPAFLIRGDAARTLGLIGSAARSAIPKLEELSRMSGREVGTDNINGLYPQEAATEALKLIGGQH